MDTRRRRHLALLLALAAPATAGAQAGGDRERRADSVVVVGLVRDADGHPVPMAQLVLRGDGVPRAMTGDDGAFRLGRLPLGRHDFLVRRLGYEPRRFSLRLHGTDTVRVNVVLVRAPLELAGVQVRAAMLSDFDRRRTRGLGVFYDSGDVRRRRPGVVSDLFRTTTGITVIRDAAGLGRVYGRAVGQAGGCEMTFVVDGMRLGTGYDVDRDIPPGDVAAIEVYRGPSEIPVEYLGRGTWCGLVVVWTRRADVATGQ